MGNSLFYFNRRGAVCALRRDIEVSQLPHEEAVSFRAISSLQARCFLVMKHIDMKLMLVAPVFTAKRKDTKSIGINGKRFWVNFMTFYVVPVGIMEAVPGKYLDYSFKTITAIYESHNNVLRAKWRQETAAREAYKALRQTRQRYCEGERHRLAKKELRIPGHLLTGSPCME